MINTVVTRDKSQLVDPNKPIHMINSTRTIRLIATMEMLNFEGSYGRCQVGQIQYFLQGTYLFEIGSNGLVTKDNKKGGQVE